MTNRTCTIGDCTKPHVARDMCSKHYEAEKYAGRLTPLLNFEQRFWAKVDKTPTCWNWTAVMCRGYGRFSVRGRLRYAHRVVYEMVVGPIPDGLWIDHRCHNRACVNPAHLRLATRKQNCENRAGASSLNKSSGVRGVSKASKNRWVARLSHNGEAFDLGLFETIAEAEAVVIAKRNELYTHNDLDRV